MLVVDASALRGQFTTIMSPFSRQVKFLRKRSTDSTADLTENAPLVSISADGYLRIWDIQAGKLLHEVSSLMRTSYCV